jgi:polysaccharide pyruvyl transferase WcaK-like protein
VRFVILHGYSDSNKGDLAIVAASIHALRDLYPDSQIVLQSVFPKHDPEFNFHHRFVTRLGVEVEPMGIPSPYSDTRTHSFTRNLLAFWHLAASAVIQTILFIAPALRTLFPQQAAPLDHLRAADIVLLKGGQYIYNDQGGVRGLLYLWRVLHPIRVARRLGKPTIMLGQSVGPLLGSRARAMVASALSGCRRLIVREALTADLLAQMGLKHLCLLAPDMAFLTKPRRPSDSSASLSKLESGGWLGVTVVNWGFPQAVDAKAARADYERALVEICEHVHKRYGLAIALFPQVTVRHHGESDLDLIERIMARLAARGVAAFAASDDLWPDELSYLYGKCQALLGTRLHSCILAACAGCPVVAIRYQGFKTEGVMHSLGLDELVHDINTLDASAVVASIAKVLSARDQYSTAIEAHVRSFQRELREITKREIDGAFAAVDKSHYVQRSPVHPFSRLKGSAGEE